MVSKNFFSSSFLFKYFITFCGVQRWAAFKHFSELTNKTKLLQNIWGEDSLIIISMSFIVTAQPSLMLPYELITIWQKLATYLVILSFFPATQDALASFAHPPLQLGRLAVRPVECACGKDVCSLHDCLKMAHMTSMVMFSFV